MKKPAKKKPVKKMNYGGMVSGKKKPAKKMMAGGMVKKKKMSKY